MLVDDGAVAAGGGVAEGREGVGGVGEGAHQRNTGGGGGGLRGLGTEDTKAGSLGGQKEVDG